MEAAILARVSSKEQSESGYSLPAQEKLMKEYCEHRAIKPVLVCLISETASKAKQRTQFNSFLADLVKRGIKVLVVEKTDRLTRSLKDAVRVDEWLEEDDQRELHLVKDGLVLHKNSKSQEKLSWNLRVILAKNYTDNLSEEVRKGRNEKFAQGIYPGPSPFGCLAIDQGRRKVHAIDPTRSMWASQMFQLADEGFSLRQIETKLFDAGLRTKSGKKVSRSNIHRYLTDPFYMGDIDWDGKRGPGIHEPIITQALFDRVQKKLKRPEIARYRSHNHLFRCLIHCGECGGVITWEIHKGTTYGHCNHYRKCSQNAWVKEQEIESQILPSLTCLEITSPRLADWIVRALKESHRDESTYRETSTQELQKELTKVDTRISLLYEDRLDQRITAEMYDLKYKQFTEEKAVLQQKIQSLSEGGESNMALNISFFELSQRAQEFYLSGSTDEKRTLLNNVFSKIELNDRSVKSAYTYLFSVLAKAVDATNSSKVRVEDLSTTPNFELERVGSTKQKTTLSGDLCFVWRDRRDSNSRPPQ